MKKYLAAVVLAAALVLPVLPASPAGAVGSGCQLIARNFDPNRLGPNSPVQLDWHIANPTSFVLLSLRIGPSAPWSSYPPYTTPGPYWYLRLVRGSQHVASSGGFFQPWNFNHEPEPNFIWDFGDISVGKGTVMTLELLRSYGGAWHVASRWSCSTSLLPNNSI